MSREILSFTQTKMKVPNPKSESFEFNLGKASTIRCLNTRDTTTCGKCAACILRESLEEVKEWFPRAGDQSKRQFMLGIIRRLHSVDLVQYVINLLQPLLCKDYTYARTRIKPSMKTDRATMCADRALNIREMEMKARKTWAWFQAADYWTKSNFTLGMLHECECHLLFVVGTHAKTLLASERNTFIDSDDYESASVASTTYTFCSDDHPELSLFTESRLGYTPLAKNPFGDENSNYDAKSQLKTPTFQNSAIPEDCDDSISSASGPDSGRGFIGRLDPTCLVIPTSAKAYAGVSLFRDFVRHLPVHLSKYVLSFLDRGSLHSCLFVCKIWKQLAEEVHNEHFVNQHLREEVMLMQGASAQGCNPIFARDIDVPVPNTYPKTFECIKTGEELVETTYKSEASLETAYSGYSTRQIIMEERNIYCGAYNVMVLRDKDDPHRVVHTDGGKLIALGSQDRKVRFINCETGKDHDLVISGHAGSVRCVLLREEEEYILSGGYDTSIRKWSLKTGKCQKIFRGHQDTVKCLKVHGDYMISGGGDSQAFVWGLLTGKSVHNFKHKHPVVAVGIGEEMCITAEDNGNVKVWHLPSGEIIKNLVGHHDAVTAIKFDKWHIVTGAKDGYALVWSAQGNHDKCLGAFRHPKAVLCLEFVYLRVITGNADGKVRIWNLITGECLRIMRGNSKSDPIQTLIAIGNRITINTCNNLLTLNFEPVEYDYTLDSDKMPPLIRYGKFTDAPVRKQPYAYIRAQRMNKAGATNQKIIQHEKQRGSSALISPSRKVVQTPHSAKSLGKKSMETARMIQSSCGIRPDSGYVSHYTESVHDDVDVNVKGDTPSLHAPTPFSKRESSMRGGRMTPLKTRTSSAKSGTVRPSSAKSESALSVGFHAKLVEEDSDMSEDGLMDMHRRVSWAFENPFEPKQKDMGLPETKALLRSQIRARGDVVPPDFIYLAVNAIQSSMKPTEVQKNMEMNMRTKELERMKRMNRPKSSPSRVDPRTKVPVEELDLEQFIRECGVETDMTSEIGSRHSSQTGGVEVEGPITSTTYVTQFKVVPVTPREKQTIFSKKVRSTIPKATIIRPHTATVVAAQPDLSVRQLLDKSRPHTVQAATRPGTALSMAPSVKATGTAHAPQSSTRQTHHGYKTSATEASFVPMLMYSKDVTSKIQELKDNQERRKSHLFMSRNESAPMQGRVSEYTNPMRVHPEFKLLTHKQVQQNLDKISEEYDQKKQKLVRDADKHQQKAWLNKVRQLVKQPAVSDKPTTPSSRLGVRTTTRIKKVERVS